jgi:hypothetical protein
MVFREGNESGYQEQAWSWSTLDPQVVSVYKYQPKACDGIRDILSFFLNVAYLGFSVMLVVCGSLYSYSILWDGSIAVSWTLTFTSASPDVHQRSHLAILSIIQANSYKCLVHSSSKNLIWKGQRPVNSCLSLYLIFCFESKAAPLSQLGCQVI